MSAARSISRRRLNLALLAAALVAATPVTPLLHELAVGAADALRWIDVDNLRDLVRGFGVRAPVASISLTAVHDLVPLPVEVLTVANGLLFGFWEGVVVTWTGMMLASWSGFLAARHVGRPLALRWVSAERLERLSGWAAGSPWKLLAVRQVPIFSFCLLNVALGLLDVPLRRFTWTTALGNVPYVVLIVLTSDALASTT